MTTTHLTSFTLAAFAANSLLMQQALPSQLVLKPDDSPLF